MSVLARAGLAVLFCGLAVAALLYSIAATPAEAPGQASPPAFAWTAAELACFEAYENCNRERLVDGAPAAPLSARPFALQLVEGIVSGDEEAARLLAAEVLARDPRSRDARQVLAAAALRAGDVDGFLVLFLPLFDVDAVQRDAYADFLAGLSKAPEIRAALAPKLRDGATWSAAYLSALTRRGGLTVSDLIPLYAHAPARVQAQFLQRLTTAGQWDMAYVAFAEFTSAGPLGADGGEPDRGEALALSVPFNPLLRPSAAPAPFNWWTASRSAQLLEEGGAYAFYEGRKVETLLVQSFPLSPGAYTLAAEHSGEASETGGYFSWQIACADGGGPALARFDVRALKAASSQETWDFELAPGTCPYLRLSLNGVPGGFPRPARIELKSVRLSRRSPQAAAP
jgi:hypothetical protein